MEEGSGVEESQCNQAIHVVIFKLLICFDIVPKNASDRNGKHMPAGTEHGLPMTVNKMRLMRTLDRKDERLWKERKL